MTRGLSRDLTLLAVLAGLIIAAATVVRGLLGLPVETGGWAGFALCAVSMGACGFVSGWVAHWAREVGRKPHASTDLCDCCNRAPATALVELTPTEGGGRAIVCIFCQECMDRRWHLRHLHERATAQGQEPPVRGPNRPSRPSLH